MSVSSPLLSVIIPTHKRAAILARCLKHLEQQTIAKDLEVIVVSDGHDPETVNLFSKTRNSKLETRNFLEIPKSQQGIARNRGVAIATAPLVLFIGDDILLNPEACEKHVTSHESRVTSHPFDKLRASGSRENKKTTNYSLPTTHLSTNSPLRTAGTEACCSTAVLGFTTWDPSLSITPVMRWLEQTGWQFGYPMLEPYRHAFVPENMQHQFTYTSHISLPTVIAKRTPFREDVTLYGWEDIEWGLRLRKAGVKLFYEPDAKAFHHHALNLEQSLHRMEELGKSAVFLTQIAPELDRLPHGWKKRAYRILVLLPTMRGKHAKAFVKGIHQGEADCAKP